MSISQRLFGVTPNGEKVTEYTMTNRDGASVSDPGFRRHHHAHSGSGPTESWTTSA